MPWKLFFTTITTTTTNVLLLKVFEWLIFKPPPILSSVRRPIGKLTVQEQKLEGEYRYVNSRLITNRCDSPAYTSNIYTLELSYWFDTWLPLSSSFDQLTSWFTIILCFSFSEELVFYQGNTVTWFTVILYFSFSEEIAFYQGNRREQTIILATFEKLVSWFFKVNVEGSLLSYASDFLSIIVFVSLCRIN